eukprot:4518008-Amphidinium_carterae.1
MAAAIWESIVLRGASLRTVSLMPMGCAQLAVPHCHWHHSYFHCYIALQTCGNIEELLRSA